jgi:hypothetical protein
MKKQIIIITIISLISTVLFAQKPLKGSGKVVSMSFDFKNFDKVSFEDFDGKIEVEIGKEFSIQVAIDDNLASLLRVEKEDSENQLRIWLKSNNNGRLYLENTNIKIKVTMPESSVIKHRGNTTLTVSGITGRYFRLENTGNGNAFLSGKTDELDISKTGNGEVKADKLLTKTAKIKSYGNGNVLVNAQVSMQANGAGNCSVIQFGEGKIDTNSSIIGNGKVRKA